MKKASAFDLLSKGVSSTAGGGRVSATEQTRIRRAKRKRGYFTQAKDEQILDQLRKCENILKDWPPALSWGKKVAEAFIPPPQMTIDAWADRYRRIPPEFAAEPGDWSTKRVPYMRAVMQACSPSHDCRRVVLVKPTQSGGTEAAILNTIGFTIDINPQSMLVIFPTIDLAQSFSRERLEPMVDMMPRLKDKVADVQVGPDTQNRSSVKRKRFHGGFLNFGGTNSAAGLSSRPVPIVLRSTPASRMQALAAIR